MKKMLIFLTALAMIAGFSTVSFAAITGSAHDFSAETWNGPGELCNVCHTPHNALTNQTLWNHASTAATGFTMYTNTAGETASDNLTGNKALLCLSCHDGSVALDSFGGATGSTTITGTALVSRDLSNDHPINVALDASTGPQNDGAGYKYASIVNGVINTLPLDTGDTVVCSTCHDPHNAFPANAALLRVDNDAASSLCTSCHDK